MSQRRKTKNKQIAALKAQVDNLTETQKDLIQIQKKNEKELKQLRLLAFAPDSEDIVSLKAPEGPGERGNCALHAIGVDH